MKEEPEESQGKGGRTTTGAKKRKAQDERPTAPRVGKARHPKEKPKIEEPESQTRTTTLSKEEPADASEATTTNAAPAEVKDVD